MNTPALQAGASISRVCPAPECAHGAPHRVQKRDVLRGRRRDAPRHRRRRRRCRRRSGGRRRRGGGAGALSALRGGNPRRARLGEPAHALRQDLAPSPSRGSVPGPPTPPQRRLPARTLPRVPPPPPIPSPQVAVALATDVGACLIYAASWHVPINILCLSDALRRLLIFEPEACPPWERHPEREAAAADEAAANGSRDGHCAWPAPAGPRRSI
jgi:hypothetical protein